VHLDFFGDLGGIAPDLQRVEPPAHDLVALFGARGTLGRLEACEGVTETAQRFLATFPTYLDIECWQ
jgi:hypothetical protein